MLNLDKLGIDTVEEGGKYRNKLLELLEERGVAAIYGPGTPMLESVRDVLKRISQHHD